MYSSLLDNQTLAKVIELSPVRFTSHEVIAKEILIALRTAADEGTHYISADLPESGYQMSIAEIVDMLDQRHNAHLVGRILGEMGLLKRRKSEGYEVYWNEEQFKILVNAIVHLDPDTTINQLVEMLNEFPIVKDEA